MKTLVTTYLLISAASASLVCAQNSSAAPTPPSPATIAQRRVDALTTRLGLNSMQQSQALGFFTTAAATDAPIQAELKAARQSLKAAVEANNSTNISVATALIGTLTGQIALADATAEAALYAILSPAQQTTYSQQPGLGGPGFGGPARFRRP